MIDASFAPFIKPTGKHKKATQGRNSQEKSQNRRDVCEIDGLLMAKDALPEDSHGYNSEAFADVA